MSIAALKDTSKRKRNQKHIAKIINKAELLGGMKHILSIIAAVLMVGFDHHPFKGAGAEE